MAQALPSPLETQAAPALPLLPRIPNRILFVSLPLQLNILLHACVSVAPSTYPGHPVLGEQPAN